MHFWRTAVNTENPFHSRQTSKSPHSGITMSQRLHSSFSSSDDTNIWNNFGSHCWSDCVDLSFTFLRTWIPIPIPSKLKNRILLWQRWQRRDLNKHGMTCCSCCYGESIFLSMDPSALLVSIRCISWQPIMYQIFRNWLLA